MSVGGGIAPFVGSLEGAPVPAAPLLAAVYLKQMSVIDGVVVGRCFDMLYSI